MGCSRSIRRPHDGRPTSQFGARVERSAALRRRRDRLAVDSVDRLRDVGGYLLARPRDGRGSGGGRGEQRRASYRRVPDLRAGRSHRSAVRCRGGGASTPRSSSREGGGAAAGRREERHMSADTDRTAYLARVRARLRGEPLPADAAPPSAGLRAPARDRPALAIQPERAPRRSARPLRGRGRGPLARARAEARTRGGALAMRNSTASRRRPREKASSPISRVR